jgi:hypothetical protein
MYPFREMLLKFFYRVSTPFFGGGRKNLEKFNLVPVLRPHDGLQVNLCLPQAYLTPILKNSSAASRAHFPQLFARTNNIF